MERSFQQETWQALFPIALALCIAFIILRVCAWFLWYPVPSKVNLPAFPYVVRALALASVFAFACFLSWDRWRNSTGRLLTPIHRHPFALRLALCITLLLQWVSPFVSDFYLCTTDQPVEIVNCLSFQSGAFSMPMALTIPLVCLALTSILTYAWLALGTITLSYAALYVYMFVLRNTDGANSPGPSAERADALRGVLLVAAQYGLMMVLAAFNISTRRECDFASAEASATSIESPTIVGLPGDTLSCCHSVLSHRRAVASPVALAGKNFELIGTLARRYEQLEQSVDREKTLNEDLQTARESQLISNTARGIQEMVTGFLSHKLLNPLHILQASLEDLSHLAHVRRRRLVRALRAPAVAEPTGESGVSEGVLAASGGLTATAASRARTASQQVLQLAQLAAGGVPDPSAAKAEQRELEEVTGRLRTSVNTISDLVRKAIMHHQLLSGQYKPQVQRCNVRQLLEAVVGPRGVQLRGGAARSRVLLTMTDDVPAYIYTDVSTLKSILQVAIENALQASGRGLLRDGPSSAVVSAQLVLAPAEGTSPDGSSTIPGVIASADWLRHTNAVSDNCKVLGYGPVPHLRHRLPSNQSLAAAARAPGVGPVQGASVPLGLDGGSVASTVQDGARGSGISIHQIDVLRGQGAGGVATRAVEALSPVQLTSTAINITSHVSPATGSTGSNSDELVHQRESGLSGAGSPSAPEGTDGSDQDALKQHRQQLLRGVRPAPDTVVWWLQIEVQNRGPGLAGKTADDLFVPFERSGAGRDTAELTSPSPSPRRSDMAAAFAASVASPRSVAHLGSPMARRKGAPVTGPGSDEARGSPAQAAGGGAVTGGHGGLNGVANGGASDPVAQRMHTISATSAARSSLSPQHVTHGSSGHAGGIVGGDGGTGAGAGAALSLNSDVAAAVSDGLDPPVTSSAAAVGSGALPMSSAPETVAALGLGLPVARLFALELGARVGVFDEDGQPPEVLTAFVLQLPLTREFKPVRRTWAELEAGKPPSPAAAASDGGNGGATPLRPPRTSAGRLDSAAEGASRGRKHGRNRSRGTSTSSEDDDTLSEGGTTAAEAAAGPSSGNNGAATPGLLALGATRPSNGFHPGSYAGAGAGAGAARSAGLSNAAPSPVVSSFASRAFVNMVARIGGARQQPYPKPSSSPAVLQGNQTAMGADGVPVLVSAGTAGVGGVSAMPLQSTRSAPAAPGPGARGQVPASRSGGSSVLSPHTRALATFGAGGAAMHMTRRQAQHFSAGGVHRGAGAGATSDRFSDSEPPTTSETSMGASVHPYRFTGSNSCTDGGFGSHHADAAIGVRGGPAAEAAGGSVTTAIGPRVSGRAAGGALAAVAGAMPALSPSPPGARSCLVYEAVGGEGSAAAAGTAAGESAADAGPTLVAIIGVATPAPAQPYAVDSPEAPRMGVPVAALGGRLPHQLPSALPRNGSAATRAAAAAFLSLPAAAAVSPRSSAASSVPPPHGAGLSDLTGSFAGAGASVTSLGLGLPRPPPLPLLSPASRRPQAGALTPRAGSVAASPLARGGTYGLRQGSGGGMALVAARRSREGPSADTALRVDVTAGTAEPSLAAVPQAPTATSTSPSDAGTRILVVDDEFVITKIHTRYLRRLGFTADAASDGSEVVPALDAAAAEGRPYSAILLDLVMRNVHGDRACQLARAHGFTGPVIAATGNAAPRDRDRLYAAGFTAILEKPFSIEQLRGALEHCGIAIPARSPTTPTAARSGARAGVLVGARMGADGEHGVFGRGAAGLIGETRGAAPIMRATLVQVPPATAAALGTIRSSPPSSSHASAPASATPAGPPGS
jgi:CheY-like chemotaxis protein/signal transduction histidine kinase